jgi:membrane protease YdiL (CAAX protease family)
MEVLQRADHLLAAAVALGLPLRAWFGMRRLRAAAPAQRPALRQRLLWRAVFTQWALVALVFLLWNIHGRSYAGLQLPLRLNAGLIGVLAGTATMVAILLRQRAAIPGDPELQRRLRERLSEVEPILPRGDEPFTPFVVLAVTAGVCEELLFRGFLLWYLAQALPLPLPVAWVGQAVLFGLGHAYQGRRGITGTMLVGAFLTGVVAVTGSLWAAMLLHVLIDLHSGTLARTVLPPDPGPSAA